MGDQGGYYEFRLWLTWTPLKHVWHEVGFEGAGLGEVRLGLPLHSIPWVAWQRVGCFLIRRGK